MARDDETTFFPMEQPDLPLLECALQREAREAYVAFRMRRHISNRFVSKTLAEYVRSDDCTADLERLVAGDFDFPLPHQVKLRKSHSTRRRILYIYPERQNMLMRYIAWLLHRYDCIFSDNLYSFRLKLSTADLFHKLSTHNYCRKYWVVKADVHDYGHSICPQKLLPQLQDIMGREDPGLMAFLNYLLTRDTFLREGQVVQGCMGGLPGLPLSPFINNVYLMGLDQEMARASVLCSRYADDIALFTHNRTEAQEGLDRIRGILDDLSLCLNEDKTRVLAPGEDFELLGIQVNGTNLDVANTTVDKAKQKLGHYAHKLVLKEQRRGLPRDLAVQLMVNKVNRYFYGDSENEHELSWRDFFFRLLTRPDSLRDIDHTVQNLIRYVAVGKQTDARYRFRYKDMKRLGYVPLVTEYYEYRRDPVAARQKRNH